ncbi:ABC transporter substrate-binding protein [Yinghuangia soli]|uniref:Sugar ABC transporter substrate-binding protein n=1 Tax=Yinghuangia soli TaxID=2908204 RepID=A0AA41PWD9_9ACTN|nr:sugar ABC transporter substrate-binding protein [Yinghuangia soli]MCF2525777.1 sugar ABC transporter substrate-binding protein [Yinghuangia soli]
MRVRRVVPALALTLSAFALAACGSSGDESESGASGTPKPGSTITYWASNQGTSIEHDKQVLQPELDKFTQKTGIKVDLEVVPWSDLLNRILAATSSGKGPDVLNIGNTWSASLQATGAFVPVDDGLLAKVGGKDRFLPTPYAATGAEGKPPVGLPIYSAGYGLYYNKKMFAAAGLKPPATWEEMAETGKKLTGDGRWGLALEGASYTEGVHNAYILAKQYGADVFTKDGKPDFTSPGMVQGVKRYVELMSKDKIVNPSNAEYGQGTQALKDFATGKSAMLMWQASQGSLVSNGMNPDDIGVAPVPFPAAPPAGAPHVNSMVGGINISVFKDSDNKAGAAEFVAFMTSAEEQTILNKAYGSLPSVKDAYGDPAFQTENVKVFQKILAETATPMPQVAAESQFETLVGTAVKDLIADAASGKAVTDESVKSRLKEAQDKMAAAG